MTPLKIYKLTLYAKQRPKDCMETLKGWYCNWGMYPSADHLLKQITLIQTLCPFKSRESFMVACDWANKNWDVMGGDINGIPL